MATYKVPQDVEAEDKLLGPFSFRQFVYLIIVALAGLLAWFLSQIFIILGLIPVPVILFFGALALPIKKDQPMEIYLAAVLSFYLKPRQRLWDPEGVESYVKIDTPKELNKVQTKNLSEEEAQRRFGYLANIVDSGGWAIRGANAQPNSAMISDVYYDAQNTQDLLDPNSGVAQSFNYLIDQTSERKKEEAMNLMRGLVQTQPAAQQAQAQQAQTAPPAPVLPNPLQQAAQPAVNIYTAPAPETAQVQSVPQPTQPTVQEPGTIVPTEAEKTIKQTVSPDIMELANNTDLSIATISKEANRIKGKHQQDEVVISLR